MGAQTLRVNARGCKAESSVGKVEETRAREDFESDWKRLR